MLYMNTMAHHKISWFVYAWDNEGNEERLRRTSQMRGTWAYDVECSCGWQSRTGGATERHIKEQIIQHKLWESA